MTGYSGRASLFCKACSRTLAPTFLGTETHLLTETSPCLAVPSRPRLSTTYKFSAVKHATWSWALSSDCQRFKFMSLNQSCQPVFNDHRHLHVLQAVKHEDQRRNEELDRIFVKLNDADPFSLAIEYSNPFITTESSRISNASLPLSSPGQSFHYFGPNDYLEDKTSTAALRNISFHLSRAIFLSLILHYALQQRANCHELGEVPKCSLAVTYRHADVRLWCKMEGDCNGKK